MRKTWARLDVHKSTIYNWLSRYEDHRLEGLEDRKPQPSQAWNKVPKAHQDALIDLSYYVKRIYRRVNWQYVTPMSSPTLYLNRRRTGF